MMALWMDPRQSKKTKQNGITKIPANKSQPGDIGRGGGVKTIICNANKNEPDSSRPSCFDKTTPHFPPVRVRLPGKENGSKKDGRFRRNIFPSHRPSEPKGAVISLD